MINESKEFRISCSKRRYYERKVCGNKNEGRKKEG